MTSEALISSMEKLLKLHKSLYELTARKTDIVKTGDMDALNQLLKDEQKHHAAISMVEKERQAAVQAILPQYEKPTVADCLVKTGPSDKQNLELLRNQLLEIVREIQSRNELNQQLIYQSLQFVNFSLNLVAPQQKENITYGPQAGKKNNTSPSKGMFNSKA